MSEMPERNLVPSPAKQGGMPPWLKIVIALAVVAIIGTIALVSVLGAFFVKLGKGATDPNTSDKVARQIVVFDGDLPPGWKYAMNMDVFTVKMVAIGNTKNSTLINLMQIPNPKHQSATDMAKAPALEHGRLAGSKNITVEDRGEEIIGGTKVPYVRARTDDNREIQMDFVVLPTGKAIMIQVIETGDHYDPELAKPVLDKIKGFVAS